MLLVEQQTAMGDRGYVPPVDATGAVQRPPAERDDTESPEHVEIEAYDHGSSSVWTNISVFRDFFLAAFSDGYQNVRQVTSLFFVGSSTSFAHLGSSFLCRVVFVAMASQPVATLAAVEGRSYRTKHH